MWPKRIHLFEFHDLAWFPAIFRDALTEWLSALQIYIGTSRVLAPVLSEALRVSGAKQIIDLCSGGGGSLLRIQRELEESGECFKIILTDKFPNINKIKDLQGMSGGKIEARLTSVDATAIPSDLHGFRTLFNSFHHFRPSQAQQILRDAYELRQPIGVFEITNRTLNGVAFSFFASFLSVFLLMPFMHPRRPAWWIFTYLVPIIPFIVGWDGWVSHLRAYTPEELEQMTAGLSDSYRWEVQTAKLRNGHFTMTCLLGLPL